jgi:hypothetical protein
MPTVQVVTPEKKPDLYFKAGHQCSSTFVQGFTSSPLENDEQSRRINESQSMKSQSASRRLSALLSSFSHGYLSRY